MKLQFHYLWPIVLLLIWFQENSYSKKWSSFHSIVTNYLKNDSEIRQILLFLNGTGQHNEYTHLPTILIDIQNITEYHFVARKYRRLIENPRSTLFIVPCADHDDDALTAVSKMINFLMVLAPVKRRPKVLITEKEKVNLNKRKLLRLMWSKNFLDVTVLVLNDKQTKTGYFLSDKGKILTRHMFYNPFSKKFINKTTSSKANLFPDKLRNLYGYPLKIGFFHYPPYVNILQNSTGHVTYFGGFDVVNVKSLARAKNFRIVEKLSNRTTWPVFNCIKEKNTDMFLDLMYNKIQFIGDQSGRPAGCLSKLIELSHFYQNIYYYALIPKSKEKIDKLTNKWHLLNVAIFISLLITIRIVAKLFRFNPNNWQMTNLLQVALGMCMPNEPKFLIERIVLGSMLINCFLYSSEIYSTFTSTSIPFIPPDEIETLDDLFASNLSLHVFPNIYLAVSRDATGNAKKFYARAIVTSARDEECIDFLIKHRNISCMIRHAKAQLAAITYKNEHGQPIAKVLKDYLSFLPSTFYMEEGSPYVKSVEEYLVKLGESGIYNQWSKMYLGSESTSVMDASEKLVSETVESDAQLKKSLVFILGIGCTCSAIVFIGEVIFHRYRRLLVQCRNFN